jgi:hypothetical protein
MAEFKGDSIAVDFNTVDISAQARTITVNETAGEPEEIDVSHKGDTSRQVLEGFPGTETTNVEMNILDEEGDVSALMDFALNAKDTLYIYPEGKTHTKPMLTLHNARLTERSQELPFDGASEINATFHAKNTITRGTYST